MAVSRCSLFLILWGHFLLLGAAQTCYWPDKSVAEALTSCNSMAENSHCCGTNSLCLDNGYCFNQGTRYGNRISRGACTDRSWSDNACPQYCQTIIPDGGISISLVSENDSGLFCCGVGWNTTSELCLEDSSSNDPRPFSIDIGVVILNRTSGATSLNVTTSEATTGNATTVAATTSSPQSSHVNIGTAIGAGLGSAVGILLIGATLAFLRRSRKCQTHHPFQQFDFKGSYPPTPQRHGEYVELEHSPRQFQGQAIQELEGHLEQYGHGRL